MIGVHGEPLSASTEQFSSTDTEVGGYRLVRLLGSGTRASVHLGHAEGHPPAAIKIFGSGVPPEEIEREAAALLRASGDHVVGLLDLAQDSRRALAFVLERVTGPSLGALLERRGWLRPGEAVTILAPVAATVRRLSEAGVVHGGLDLASVMFTAAGSPTLVGFGAAALLDMNATGAAAARRKEQLAVDAVALQRIARVVLERCPEADAGVVRTLLGQAEPGNIAELLAEAVFNLGEPEPVGLDTESVGSPSPPGRVPAGGREPARAATDDRRRPAAERAPAKMLLGALQLPHRLRPTRVGAPTTVQRLVSGVRSVRRSFWIAAGAAAVAVTAAPLLVPEAALPGDRLSAEPTAQAEAHSAPAARVDLTAEAGDAEKAVRGEDPAEAALALLAVRERCFRDLSVFCLDAVAQADSSAHRADVAAIVEAQQGAELDGSAILAGGEAEVVERLGDSALVRVLSDEGAGPASILLIRTEAGWRIRGFPGGSARDAGGSSG
jgi:hypothetical protein